MVKTFFNPGTQVKFTQAILEEIPRLKWEKIDKIIWKVVEQLDFEDSSILKVRRKRKYLLLTKLILKLLLHPQVKLNLAIYQSIHHWQSKL